MYLVNIIMCVSVTVNIQNLIRIFLVWTDIAVFF